MGRLLQSRQGDISLLGAGRRAGTIRSRVRNIRHFLAWHSSEQTHLTDFLQVRFSEPCNRGSLKITHESFILLDVVSGTEACSRLTNSQLYLSIYRELLSKALPGKPVKQAPRMFSSILRALEQMIISSKFPLYFRIYSWWILVQSWATLRFDDHRGINPKHVKVTSSSFTALLNRSKTIGDGKSIHSRPLVIDSACYLHSKEWMQTGWGLLSDSANFERDFLLPWCHASLML